MARWHGPGEPFAVLYDADNSTGPSLPAEARAIYGDWRLPEFPDRPYVYTNFVISHDGRISFNMPGHAGGGDVSRFDGHDRWLMGLLRARADAVLVGDTTLRTEPEHIWTAEFICPDDAEAFAALRQAEGRAARPLQVFASFHGEVPAEAAVFSRPDLRVLVATTAGGLAQALGRVGHLPGVQCIALGEYSVDLAQLKHLLAQQYGVRTLLCEGGPTLYGGLLAAGQGDDEFLTLSPIVIGASRDAPRPSLVEGAAFGPETPPSSRLLAVRRFGNYLFLHSRYGV